MSIRDAVHDVEFTLVLTIALVVMVIFVFVRRIWPPLIPALAVPISLIATLGAMYLFAFSIDNISLIGLTWRSVWSSTTPSLCWRTFVRHIEEDGQTPFEAALKGVGRSASPSCAITVSLVAVFIPVLLMGGVIGKHL